VALAVPAATAPAPNPPPRTWRALAAKQAAAEQRLAALLDEARTDPNVAKIKAYLAYSKAQFQDVKRVHADDLLDIVTEEKGEKIPAEVREQAALAIVADDAKRNDPDLSVEGRKLSRSPRAAFSLKVVKLLSNADLNTRALANTILLGLWPGYTDPDIKNYDPRRKETWGKAREAWTRMLTK
jgi:hypothetical protein